VATVKVVLFELVIAGATGAGFTVRLTVVE
jgi:hypothetical protein